MALSKESKDFLRKNGVLEALLEPDDEDANALAADRETVQEDMRAVLGEIKKAAAQVKPNVANPNKGRDGIFVGGSFGLLAAGVVLDLLVVSGAAYLAVEGTVLEDFQSSSSPFSPSASTSADISTPFAGEPFKIDGKKMAWGNEAECRATALLLQSQIAEGKTWQEQGRSVCIDASPKILISAHVGCNPVSVDDPVAKSVRQKIDTLQREFPRCTPSR